MPSKKKINRLMQRNAPSIPTKSSRAASQIQKCKATGAMWIDLSDCDLEKIPTELLELQNLELIDLSYNKIQSIPDEFWMLPKLNKVSLIGNPIRSIPDREGLIVDISIYLENATKIGFEKLELFIDEAVYEKDIERLIEHLVTNLGPRKLTIGTRFLRLGAPNHKHPDRAVRRLLASLDRFRQLEDLCLRGYELSSVPSGISALRTIRRLHLDGLNLNSLPDWIGDLPLQYLSAIGNRFTTLPTSLAINKNLKELHLSWNRQMKTIPAVIFELIGLERLSLDNCSLQEIPTEILRLKKLEQFDIQKNRIESPPPEVAAKGFEAIQNYWKQRTDAGVDYLCEAKLIILGEPGAGKTSLANKIVNREYKLCDDQLSTEGIDVLRYQFPTGIRVPDNGFDKVLDRNFQVNIWDFGGQEIYHATHQFFLTRRSVYVLVCDDRKEDTDFSYWLNVVEMLSDASPLLIVQNEKQDRTRDINLSALRARFENLRGALSTNLDTNRGLDKIVYAIQKELETMPHIGVGLPATWKRVRQVLERDERDFINLSEYLTICQNNGFTGKNDKLQLSEYLHDLGICLHFQEDPILKNTIILKPSWGTDAVYRVLDDVNIIESRGRFSADDLRRIWSEEKYRGMQHELLQLMIKFQLCYALESGHAYIAPQLLSSEHPEYSLKGNDVLVVRYEYKFLPKGILTRFIVSLHHLISDDLVWKTGVILERDGSRAEVIEDYSQRTIKARVTGPARHGLLTIIDEQLERLHRSFHRLQYDRFLPCQCKECRPKSEPYGFSLDKLIKMAEKGCQIQCYESGEMVDAAQLVRDILLGMLQADEETGSLETLITQQEKPTSYIHEVFVSYAWTKDSYEIVDQLQKVLEEKDINLIRDRDELRYKDSILEFMKRLGKGKCIIVVISEKYLKSENCMFELLQISKANNLQHRIFPIIMPDANIFKATGRISYVQHWENEIQQLDAALKTVRGNDLQNLQRDLNLYDEIRRSFDGISGMLRFMNALTPEIHEKSKFDELISRIQSQLAA